MSIKDFLSKWKTNVDESVTKAQIDATMNSSIGSMYDPTTFGTVTVTSAPIPAPAPVSLPTLTSTTGAFLATGSSSYGIRNITNGGYINPSTYNGSFNISKSDIVRFSNSAGKEIVRLTQEGKVIWADPEMNEDEAAQAFTRSLEVSAELKAGITKAVMVRIRDSVFEEIINIAKQKGTLTADDLTYLLEASKIMEKLKGSQ
jgi:hypothetical protein